MAPCGRGRGGGGVLRRSYPTHLAASGVGAVALHAGAPLVVGTGLAVAAVIGGLLCGGTGELVLVEQSRHSMVPTGRLGEGREARTGTKFNDGPGARTMTRGEVPSLEFQVPQSRAVPFAPRMLPGCSWLSPARSPMMVDVYHLSHKKLALQPEFLRNARDADLHADVDPPRRESRAHFHWARGDAAAWEREGSERSLEVADGRLAGGDSPEVDAAVHFRDVLACPQ